MCLTTSSAVISFVVLNGATRSSLFFENTTVFVFSLYNTALFAFISGSCTFFSSFDFLDASDCCEDLDELLSLAPYENIHNKPVLKTIVMHSTVNIAILKLFLRLSQAFISNLQSRFFFTDVPRIDTLNQFLKTSAKPEDTALAPA